MSGFLFDSFENLRQRVNELLPQEQDALREHRSLYLECMCSPGKLLKDRETLQELRDGILLFGVYETCKPK